MKLLTKEIQESLPKLYSTEKTPLEDKQVICKFFDPTGRGTWYVFEGEEGEFEDETGKPFHDWQFFGFCVSPLGPDGDEAGYFNLSQLESIRCRFGLRIERDIHFRPCKFSEIARMPR